MYVIFLDIDGVLRTHKSDQYWSNLFDEPIPTFYRRHFCKEAIQNLNYIIALTGSKIVITSSWRNYYTLNELNTIFRERGFMGSIIGCTDTLETRGDEIIDWLNNHTVDKYVVIDDNIKDIVDKLPKVKVIKCNPLYGLNDEVFDKVVEILG
jgi:hypothetical protein